MTAYHHNLASLLDVVLTANHYRPALRYPGRSYTFGELHEWSIRCSRLLVARGVAQGDVIAIGHTKKPLSYAMMLAALRLGVAYVNLDVASPQARTARILDTSGAALLFYDDRQFGEAMQGLADAHGCPAIYLGEDDLPSPDTPDIKDIQEWARRVDGSCIAYIMFTSGSTGVPKGVAVTHQNVLHFISWGRDRFEISPSDNFANLSPMYFDNSVFDFYVGLFSGASLSPVDRDLLADPYALTRHVGEMRCTVWFSVPSLLIYVMAMKALHPDFAPSLRLIVFGGEGYPKVELRKLYDLFSKQASLVNVYGPTECTCICSAHTLTDDDFSDTSGLPTLGYLNQNFDYLILDEEGQAATTGELCLIGPNVAAGYFNDVERTGAAFETLTAPGRYMKRMYRTGDVVREDESGRLHFVGRRDNQIKHLGYRIELEEIEHALSQLPGVSQAAVIYRRTSAAYGKILGFVAGSEGVIEAEILAALSTLIPEYMLPARIFVTPDLPKNPNGKVDRQALASLSGE